MDTEVCKNEDEYTKLISKFKEEKNEEKNKIIKDKSIKKSFIEEEEFIKNLQKQKKDFLLILDYHSDDIENGTFKKIRSNKKKEKGNNNNNNENENTNITNDNPDDIRLKRTIIFKRLMIEFTLINLLISIIFLFGYFFLIKRSFLDIMIVLRSKTMHFQSYFICIYGNWLIISSK
jgi:hypothetical protein